MYLKNIKLLLVLLFSILLLGCQSTPNDTIVINKNGLVNIETEVYSFSNYPQSYQENITTADNKLISFDADIKVPSVNELSILTSHQQKFSQQDVSNIIGNLFENQTLYEIEDEKLDDLESRYIKLKEELGVMQANPDKYEFNLDDFQNQLDNLILQIEEKRKSNNQLMTVSPILIAYNDMETFSGQGVLPDGQKADLIINNFFASSTLGNKSYLKLNCGRNYVNKSVFFPAQAFDSILNVDISKDEAQKIADSYLSLLDIDYMVLSGYDIGIFDDGDNVINGIYNKKAPNAHLFIYSRSIEGSPLTYDIRNRTNFSFNQAYSQSVDYEFITIGIDDKGLACIEWNGKLNVAQIVHENSIVKFDHIIEIATNQINYSFTSNNLLNDNEPTIMESYSANSVKKELVIENIVLGYMQIPDPWNNQNFTIQPVWDFYGEIKDTMADGNIKITYYRNKSILTINALTGAIIDRNIGY